MLILTWTEYNSHGQSYESKYYIEASSKEEVDDILEDVENRGIDRNEFRRDDSKAPKDFGYAGGFCGDLLSVVDELGTDRSDWVTDWYGPVS